MNNLGLQITPTKGEIVEKMAEDLGFTLKEASDATKSILEIIKANLESGEDVLISGFGKFSVKKTRKRRGRNPATGENMMLSSRKVVTFKCSGKLRKRVNGGQTNSLYFLW